MKTKSTIKADNSAKIIVATFIACGIIFTSCKKDRTCTCTYTSTYISGSYTSVTNETNTTTIKKVDKQHANLVCSSNTYSATSGTGTNSSTSNSSSNCTLK